MIAPTPVGLELDENTHILKATELKAQHSTGEAGFHVDGEDTKRLVETDEKAQGTSNLVWATSNFINSIIGSGIIGMPYALKQAGIGLGIVLMVVVAVVTDYSILLLIRSGQLTDTNTYQGMVQVAFGRGGFYALSIMQFLYPFIVGEDSILGNRHFIICVATLLTTLPLSLYRNIARLGKISLVALVFVAFIVVVVLVKTATIGPHIPVTEGAWNFANKNVTQAIGIMSFAFMCHHNSFLIYDSLEQPTLRRWNQTTHISVLVSFLTTVVFALAGYITFTGHTQGDVLENYCRRDDLMNAARVLFAITIMFTYPIECFVTREVLENAIFVHRGPETIGRHIFTTIAIVVATVLASMATDCLGIVLELNGVLAAAPLAFILPAVCYIKVQEGSILSRDKFPAFLCALFGLIVAVAGLVLVIYNVAMGEACSHGKEPAYCYLVDHANAILPPGLHFNSTDIYEAGFQAAEAVSAAGEM
ncbi:PREDICTED: putative sodium-coupled neutral amino acid transporter 11 [Priapulus caudatus]|uniref:Putative sodium-coupled neutral amino acid transporter 11 n=1 Tax=Priapulus caudatus TaxID=37621 RepID=A0ABM1EQZ1_PRICU|nr:PREDICTED: putative sodium-coupled neutral amino acid transporter 11 [Priapulus caudatus]